MDVVQSVEIDAAAEAVWAVMADVERWPEWTASTRRAQRLDGGPFGVGSAVRVKQPRLLPMVWRVTEFEPGRSFTWVARSGGVASRGVHRIAPAAGGGVTVTLEIHQTGLLAGLVGLLYGGMIRRYVAMEAEGLKRRCEQR